MMRGCLFIIVLGLAALALVIVVGLPAVFAGALTAGVTAAGLQADDTTVTVSSDPPTDLVGLHADRVRVRATDATFRGLQIGALDVTLGDVAIADRTARTVDGRLTDVVVPNVGGREVRLGTITLSGGGDAVTATTTIGADQAERLVADALESRLDARPRSVRLATPDRITLDVGGLEVHGRLAVTADGDLVVRVTDGPAKGQVVTLLAGGEDLPIHLTSVTVTDGGLRLAGELAVSLLG